MNDSNRNRNPLYNYTKYSSLIFQFILLILGGVFGGRQLDRYVEWKFPLFTLVFTILALAISMFLFFKEVFKKDEE